jgi:hypothetical protein
MRNILSVITHKWNNRNIAARKRMWDREYASGFGDQLRLPEALEHNLVLASGSYGHRQ